MHSGDPHSDNSTDHADRPQTSNQDEEHPIRGVVNRAYVPNQVEIRPIRRDRSIDTVLISIHDARILVELHGETAQTYFRDDQTIITTTTVHDEKLRDLDWQRELAIVQEFSPDYHLPTDYSVYETMPALAQARAIHACYQGTLWMDAHLHHHQTDILLQAKGWKPWHYELCKPLMKELDTQFLVFYAAGYKQRTTEVVGDIRTLVEILEPTGVLIIGQQSPRFLERAPPEVIAVAGTRWMKQCGHTEGAHDPHRHRQWKRNIEAQLGAGQTTLAAFTTGDTTHG